MHVAINALFLVPPMGGLETYLRELSRALLARPDAPRLTIYLTPAGYATLSQEDWTKDATLVNATRMGRQGLRAAAELFALGPVADRAGADVIHSLALTGPLFSRAKRVVTIADTTWITQPSSGSPTQALWRAIVPRVTKRADLIVAIAEASRADVAEHLNVSDDRLFTTLLGAGTPPAASPTPERELRERLGIGDGPIVLNVGQRGPHRNLAGLIGALAIVRETVPDATLVLPGYSSAELDAPLRELAKERGVADAVHFTGFASHDDLDGLYVAAGAFVMPSFTEGFGLPVLEALQRGAPVACSQGTAPEEIAGDAALTFDPHSEADIAAATVRLLTDEPLRRRLAVDGPARAAEFTWDRCANQTMAVYERALSL